MFLADFNSSDFCDFFTSTKSEHWTHTKRHAKTSCYVTNPVKVTNLLFLFAQNRDTVKLLKLLEVIDISFFSSILSVSDVIEVTLFLYLYVFPLYRPQNTAKKASYSFSGS